MYPLVFCRVACQFVIQCWVTKESFMSLKNWYPYIVKRLACSYPLITRTTLTVLIFTQCLCISNLTDEISISYWNLRVTLIYPLAISHHKIYNTWKQKDSTHLREKYSLFLFVPQTSCCIITGSPNNHTSIAKMFFFSLLLLYLKQVREGILILI